MRFRTFSVTTEITTCTRCGAEYQLTWVSSPMRDTDSIDCEICRQQLVSWNGGTTCSATLVKAVPWPRPT